MAKKEKKKERGLQTPSSIEKLYPGAGLASNLFNKKEDLWLPSRCIPFNHITGGGIPYGKQMEIYGTESSGKTLAAIDFAGVAQSLGGLVLWDDAEQAFTKSWAEINGLDLSRIYLYNETAIEHISDWLADMAIYARSQLTHNEPILFVCDSLAGVDCLENINSTQTDAKAEMGNRAKAIYKMLRIRNKLLAELGICSIFINQIRHKVGASKFEDPDTTPGGGAMKFYAAQRMGFYGGKQIKEDINNIESRIGVTTSIRVKKNKVAPPRSTIKVPIYFNPAGSKAIGFDKYAGLLEIFLELGTLTKKKGSSMIYYKDTLVARGEDSFLRKMETDDDLRKKLIKKSGINTVSKTRATLDSLTTNRYPLKKSTTKFEKQQTVDDDEEE